MDGVGYLDSSLMPDRDMENLLTNEFAIAGEKGDPPNSFVIPELRAKPLRAS